MAAATATPTLREIVVGSETVILLSDTLGLVASQSEPGVWHRVTYDGGTPSCDCRGFAYRGICRHPKALNDARWLAPADRAYVDWLERHAFGAESLASEVRS